ncbi:MAG: hypothetical protein U9N87_02305, partial [Planctomycetota bacterium]|nr:hypothetical protein [Planctomycetota bacterium]
MCHDENPENHPPIQPHCCPCCDHSEESSGVSRRGFIGGVSGIAMAGLSWSALSAAQSKQSADGLLEDSAPPRKTLVVKPIFIYSVYQRRPQTSWRPWGGIQTQSDADKEVRKITSELKTLESQADFPVKFQSVAAVKDQKGIAALKSDTTADVYLIYAAGGGQATLTDAIGLSAA